MNVLTWVTLFFFLFTVIVYAITASFKKAIRYTMLAFAILSVLSLIIIFSDSKQLLGMSTSNSLFIYTFNNDPEFGIIVDFSTSNSVTLEQEETFKLYQQFLEKSPELKAAYFRTFTFSQNSLSDLLSEEIAISGKLKVSKNEVLEGINSKNLDDRASFFALALFDIFGQLNQEEKMILFLKHYNQKNIQIYPKIKAISILSIMPETLIKTVMK